MSSKLLSAGDAVEEYLYGRVNYERRVSERSDTPNFRFETIQQLLGRRGDPHLRFPVVHVAGTKGKGSVVAMVAAILRAAGYRTGVYSSPHLENLRERIAVDGNSIGASEFCRLIDSFREDVADLDRRTERQLELHPPTFFEILTSAAFDFFASQSVDAAIVEVGMGGRLDSTNVCRPLITVITTIGLDHQRILGGTPSLIAAEKAGIIKPTVPLICGVQSPKPADVIRAIALEREAPTYWLGRDFRCRAAVSAASGEPNRFDTWGRLERAYELRNCQIKLLGRHQACNAAIAIAVAQLLAQRGWALDEPAIRRGLGEAHVNGRFQVVRGVPPVVLDIAHNELSIRAFVRTLGDHFGSDPRGRTLIFSASRDKRIAAMMASLFPHFDRVILTKIVDNPRGCEIADLQRIAGKVAMGCAASERAPPAIETAYNSQIAWEMAKTVDPPCRCVAITGSAFLIGEMLPVIRNDRNPGSAI